MAAALRRDLQLSLEGPLDPRVLAKYLGVTVWTPNDISALVSISKETLHQLLVVDADNWSAVTLVLPTGGRVIVINSAHSHVRQHNDLMHELAHILLGHKPARVDVTPDQLLIMDSYDDEQEAEADWLAAALLVPREPLLQRLRKNSSSASAAAFFEVSTALLDMRRRRTGIDEQLRRANVS
jgi:Zn-dependent peptidase ImmA (M78 family)